jgi:hypothetical protein
MKIQTLNLIGKNGEKVPEGITAHDREMLFPPMGIVKVVALEWALPDGTLHTLSLLTEAKKLAGRCFQIGQASCWLRTLKRAAKLGL